MAHTKKCEIWIIVNSKFICNYFNCIILMNFLIYLVLKILFPICTPITRYTVLLIVFFIFIKVFLFFISIFVLFLYNCFYLHSDRLCKIKIRDFIKFILKHYLYYIDSPKILQNFIKYKFL